MCRGNPETAKYIFCQATVETFSNRHLNNGITIFIYAVEMGQREWELKSRELLSGPRSPGL